MERQLPEIKIGETIFIVDVAFAELRQKEEPLNTISFYDLEDKGTHYDLNFDTRYKNISQPFGRQDNTILVEIPQMVVLDPEGMATKYGNKKEALPARDEDCKCPEELFIKREYELPKISICQDEYFVDWRLKALHCIDQPGISIELDKLEMSPGGDKYVCFYNTQLKEVVDIPGTITELPKDVVMVAIPNELYLDPVAVARENNMGLRVFIDKYPLQAHMEARAYPLSQTSLPKLIVKNRAKLERTKNSKPKSNLLKRKKVEAFKQY